MRKGKNNQTAKAKGKGKKNNTTKRAGRSKSGLLQVSEIGNLLYDALEKKPSLDNALKDSPFFPFFKPFYKRKDLEDHTKEKEEESEEEEDEDDGDEKEDEDNVDEEDYEEEEAVGKEESEDEGAVESEINEKMFTKSTIAMDLLLSGYNKSTNKFEFGKWKLCTPTAKDFATIFGFKRLVEEPELKKILAEGARDEHWDFLDLQFNREKNTMVTKKQIQEKLLMVAEDDTNTELFMRIFAMYLCTVFFFTDASGVNFAAKWLPHIYHMDKVSWPDHIVNHLLCKLKNRRGQSVHGCTAFILV